jgi:transcription elongation factor Elf1
MIKCGKCNSENFVDFLKPPNITGIRCKDCGYEISNSIEYYEQNIDLVSAITSFEFKIGRELSADESKTFIKVYEAIYKRKERIKIMFLLGLTIGYLFCRIIWIITEK